MMMNSASFSKIVRKRLLHNSWRCSSVSVRFISSRTTTNNKNNNNNKKDILKPGFQPSGVTKDGVYLGSSFLMLSPTLPEINCAAILHQLIFTRKVGHSINGNDAAMRLSKAKQELRAVIEEELRDDTPKAFNANGSIPKATNASRNFGGEKKMYILRRHGIPNQLLQHVLQSANQWLKTKTALEFWIDSSSQRSLSVMTTDGSSWRTLWPTEWDDDLALYLAAMKRIVSHLACMTPFCDSVASVLPNDLEWKVSISRHNKLPLTLFPNNNDDEPNDVLPVVEWVSPVTTKDVTKKPNARKIGKILVRLQGAIDPIINDEPADANSSTTYGGVKQAHDVSLIFEANFDITDSLLAEQEDRGKAEEED